MILNNSTKNCSEGNLKKVIESLQNEAQIQKSLKSLRIPRNNSCVLKT